MLTSLRAKDLSLTSIFPDIPKVEKLVVFAPEESISFDRWVWIRSLQGLANRGNPHLYIVSKGDVPEEHWLKLYSEEYGVPVIKTLKTPGELLAEYGSLVKGCVVYDEKDVIQTQNIALTLCGLESLLPAAPSEVPLLAEYGIRVKNNFQNRFKTDLDAAEWAIDNLWPRCNRRMVANVCIHRPSWYALTYLQLDYLVANSVFCVDLPKARIFRRSLALYEKMMKTAEAPGVLLHWHCSWDQEKEYVALGAKCGFFALCSGGAPNLSLHGGMGDVNKTHVQPLPKKEDCIADENTVYFCLYNSDGDAPWALLNLQSRNWIDKDRGNFKFGWGFLPLAVKMMPAVMKYFHDTRMENDCFFAPSSGAGYTYSWAWPEDLRRHYLEESVRLLKQSGQNGCNMVNWFLQDYWREVENDAAVRLEQEVYGKGEAPGLVCGLGGSPFAKSYPQGPIPKTHSVHIANVGNDNIGDIVKFAKECPTRPCFMFLFAQISTGIFAQLNGEMDELAKHKNIKLLSMDEFFLTLQDAVARGLVGDELYERTDALKETWLKGPGRHRLPLYEKLCAELDDTAKDTPENRAKRIADAGYTQLVSGEIEWIAHVKDSFVAMFKDRRPYLPEEEADALLYTLFTVAWGVVRSVVEAAGIYGNHRTQCLNDFYKITGEKAEYRLFKDVFDAWENWESGAPAVETIVGWCGMLNKAAAMLNKAYGDDSVFEGWLPKTI